MKVSSRLWLDEICSSSTRLKLPMTNNALNREGAWDKGSLPASALLLLAGSHSDGPECVSPVCHNKQGWRGRVAFR